MNSSVLCCWPELLGMTCKLWEILKCQRISVSLGLRYRFLGLLKLSQRTDWLSGFEVAVFSKAYDHQEARCGYLRFHVAEISNAVVQWCLGKVSGSFPLQVSKIFTKFDADGSGELSVEELESCWMKVAGNFFLETSS